MANGRNQVHRRKHANRSKSATARNTKPRLGSKEGIDARHDRRLATHPKNNSFPKVGPDNQRGKPPGSRNPRKVGR